MLTNSLVWKGNSLMSHHTIISALLGLSLGAWAPFSQAAVLASSTFDTGGEAWGSFSFAGGSNPNFGGTVGGTSAVLFNGANGNPAGSIEKVDPDGGWQYFVAPGAFLGNLTGALGGTLTFQQQRRDTLNLVPTTPSALAAISDGTTVLIYGNTAPAPGTGTWTDYTVSFAPNAAGWFVDSTGGAAAAPAQLAAVLGNLSNLWIAGEWFAGAVSTNQSETIALDNVVLTGVDLVPEPVSAPGTLALLLPVLLFGARRRAS
jgi:hypothetical protein